MYSYEERLRAVKLYIQYDKSYASVFRELGYPPSNHTLKLWFREYEQNGDLHKSYIKTSIYTADQRKAAIQYYIVLRGNLWYIYRKNRRNRLLSSYVPEKVVLKR